MALKIYYAKRNALSEADFMEKAMKYLPAVRLAKVGKLKQAEDKMRSVAAGLLLEYGLREQGILGKEAVYAANADGKPYLAEYPELFYNLSHAGDYVALVIGDVPVGIDVERFRENQQKLVRRFFSKEEQAVLEAEWSDSAFTRMWTRKESYVKAEGCGMRGLSEAVTVSEDVVVLEGEAETYYLKSFLIEENYWLSVCQKERMIQEIPVEVDLCLMN